MSNLMSSAEIVLWDMIVPINKKSKIQENLKSKEIQTKSEIASAQDQKVKKEHHSEISLKGANESKPQVKESAITKSKIAKSEEKPASKSKTYKPQVFMILSSSTLGFMIGVMVSLFL